MDKEFYLAEEAYRSKTLEQGRDPGPRSQALICAGVEYERQDGLTCRECRYWNGIDTDSVDGRLPGCEAGGCLIDNFPLPCEHFEEG